MKPMRLAGAVLGLATLFVSGAGRALSPDRRLPQLHHTAWTLESGAPADVWALVQATDGFLWLGTGDGLYRFDGLRFEAVHPDGDKLPSRNVTSLLAAHDGSLWIGSYAGEVSRLVDGRLRTFGAPAPGSVQQLAEAPDGTIWAAFGNQPNGGLARFDGQRWVRLDAKWGVPDGGFYSVLAARDGTVWAASEAQVLVLRPGERRFRPVAGTWPRVRLLQSPDGRIWCSAGSREAILSLVRGEPTPIPMLPGADALITDRAIFDRDGALWESTKDGGIARVTALDSPAPRFERFTAAAGLTSDVAVSLVEDREGDIWVGSNLGLDRFRAASAVAALGLPETVRGGFEAAAEPGAGVFVTAGNTLRRIDGDGPGEMVARLPAPATLLQPRDDGTLVVGIVGGGLLSVGGGSVKPLPGPSGGGAAICSWSEDEAGTQWVSVEPGGVFFRAKAGPWLRFVPGGDANLAASLHTVSGPGGGSWFYAGERIFRRAGGRLMPFGSNQGLAVGTVNILALHGDDLLVGGEDGVAQFTAGRFRTVASDRSPALSRVTGIARVGGAIWVNGIAGLLRITEPDFEAALAAPGAALRFDLLDLADGLPGVAQQDHGTPTAIASGDGRRLWLVQSHGVAFVDPARLARLGAPPPIVVRSVAARGQDYPFPQGALTLEAGTAAIQVDYAALSLSKPEQVAFRYRLEGLEDEWVEAGGRRQAFYTRLAPGRYIFHVIARNGDGVWNTTGAAIPIVIPPTFVQSVPFALLCLLLAACLVWLAWSRHLRVSSRRLRDRFEARLAERERIARELHDTLLQGFGGLMLRFQAALAGLAPDHTSRRKLEEAMDLADDVLREGRARLVDLRETEPPRDVPQSFAAAAERLALAPRTRLRVTVEGPARPLDAEVAEELARIGEEAIANVQRHAAAQRLEASVTYGDRELRISFWDDGVGIGADVLAQGGRHGHYGLRGMRERAERLRGRLTVRSAPEFGTAIMLSVPASVAYAPAGGNRRHASAASARPS